MPNIMANPFAVMLVVVVLVLFTGFVLLLAKRYKRCPSNRVLVVYGKVGGGRSCTTIHGGASFVIPLIQDYAYLSLEPIQIEVPLKDALSIENIRVNVPSVFTVAIGTEPEVMQNAAIRLLGLDTHMIKKQAEDIIFGQLRQVIAMMHIEDINRDRESFLVNIQNSVEPELRKIGLVLINVNITDITDASGYIEAIGQKAASQAIQQARGDVAEQEKLGEVRVAEADKEKVVQVAGANKMREIGMREAQRDQAVRVAELDRDQKIAEQAAVFARDAQVKEEERKMRIAIAEANAKAVAGENEAQAQVADATAQLSVRQSSANAVSVEGENEAKARVAASTAALQVKQAEAFQLGETRKREAEAAVLEAQNRALARAALAEAEKVEAERRAEVEAPAKAEKAKTIVEAEALAERRRIEAQGEASAIFAKLEAEARGQYEILAKKGEGLHAIIKAAGGSDEAFKLLMLEHLDTLAQTAAKAISNIKFDKVIVWENGANNGTSVTSNFLQGFARTLPPMLQVMKDIGGIELPETLVKLSENGTVPSASTPEPPKPDSITPTAQA